MQKWALIAGASVSFGLAVADLALLNLHLVPSALGGEGVAAERADAVAEAAVEPEPAMVAEAPAEPEPAAVAEAAAESEPAAVAEAAVEAEPAAVAAAVEPEPEAEPEHDAEAVEPAQEAVSAAAEPAPAPERVLIGFPTDGAELSAAARDRLDDVVALLETDPALQVHIQGHADERGTSEHNEELSERRASSVAEYLMSRQIPADRLVTEAFGEKRPLIRGEGGEAWRKNRRVELRFERGRP